VMSAITTQEHRRAASRMLDLIATYREAEDLINIGAYVKGSNPKIDESVKMREMIRAFLRQQADEHEDLDTSIKLLIEMMTAK